MDNFRSGLISASQAGYIYFAHATIKCSSDAMRIGHNVPHYRINTFMLCPFGFIVNLSDFRRIKRDDVVEMTQYCCGVRNISAHVSKIWALHGVIS